MAAAVSLAAMVTSIRRRTNLERQFNFIPDVELVEYINYLCTDLYDLLVEVGGQEWFRKTWALVTNSTDDEYPLPPDFYKLSFAEIQYDTTIKRVIQPYMDKESAAYTLLSGWNVGMIVWYRMIGKDKIRFIPKPGATFTVNLHGYPTFQKLTVASYTDATQRRIAIASDAFDGINGWEEYVIWKTVAYCQAKRNLDPSFALGRAAELDQRIRGMAMTRDMNNPERVQDVIGYPDDGWGW